jgi:hypothetical protein
VILDAERYGTYPKRLRVLRDGRVALGGGLLEHRPDLQTRAQQAPYLRPVLQVSADQGRTWSAPLYIVAPDDARYGGEEFDFAELPNGDLLLVLRVAVYDPATGASPGEVRRQCRLTRDGETWQPGPLQETPFPHSGHPELLATREGLVLHLATSGIHATADGGETWTQLDLPGTAYYPRSVQLPDGRLFCVGHVGSDDAYGRVDQSIVAMTFRVTGE